MKYVWALCIAAIAAIMPARADDATVVVTAAPNLSFAVPKGWQACDPAIDKLLGSVPDPDGATAGFCKTRAGNPEFNLGFYAPKLGETVYVTVTFREATRMTAEMLAKLTAAQLSATAESLKPTIRRRWQSRATNSTASRRGWIGSADSCAW